ncbi:MAG: response regulator [Deltaproteobacteria bacterium]|nr:response regulator [Deltaproteobacteria bacterium]
MAKILVVDDDPVITMFLTEELSSMGYEVTGTATSADEAIHKAEADPPDLILMDIVLQGTSDGFATARAIRNNHDIPVIFISGHKKDKYIQKIMACNAAGFITKPIEIWQLKASIEIALHKHVLDQEVKRTKLQLQQQVEAQTAVMEKTNLELRQNEAHLRSLMETASHFAIFRLSAEPTQPLGFQVIFVSPSITEIMGTADPMEFSAWFENVHPEEKAWLFETLRESFATRDFHRTLRLKQGPTGRQRWVQLFSKFVNDPESSDAYVNGIFIDITRQKTAENELAAKSAHLGELNTAMKVLLQRREEDRKAVEERILQNVKAGILPHLERLQRAPLPNTLKNHVNAIENQLVHIVSPFLHELSTKYLDLTPTEIQIAKYVREGRSSKEIAELLGVAKCTVDTHRNNLRKKLRIQNKKENLRSRLISLDIHAGP